MKKLIGKEIRHKLEIGKKVNEIIEKLDRVIETLEEKGIIKKKVNNDELLKKIG